LLKFLSNLSKFIWAQLHFVTAQLAILHKYNNFHVQTEFFARSIKKKKFPHMIANRATEKKKHLINVITDKVSNSFI
jgi:hypothetical protein